ncbi:hypothetical protein SAMN05444004_1257 [Jannaschia faecimaris]|uniref:Uncharacterized protein n=1 Tax=Jannaschia faecimaris TaxID=1244108 RepID=A0A1H3U8N7_9RHOB|nr:hypothetical protein SAMN05444004_1257 [Jannaschia faecimaris]
MKNQTKIIIVTAPLSIAILAAVSSASSFSAVLGGSSGTNFSESASQDIWTPRRWKNP